MPNPFESWLPMYPAGTMPDRPMWRDCGGTALVRIDGAAVECREGEWRTYAPLPMNRRLRGAIGYEPDDGWRGAVDRCDIEHPCPVPPPMVGQVWVNANPEFPGTYDEFSVIEVRRRTAGARVIYSHGSAQEGAPWPPPRAVLVAGPTPWGRDRPWHPPDWRP